MSDPRLGGCQHFTFKEYKDASGARIIGGHANGSVSFQLDQLRVGKDTVPISIVLYIDGSLIKQGIPISPVYSELTCYIGAYIPYMLYNNILYAIQHVINNISCIVYIMLYNKYVL